ncbi:nuclear receptor subfamily 2 group E member 1-like [Diaphorina citri]|uniref:Nuclear receptor subfamily 2 group E member 1-like n=1 Tax=Diaphorina citri TaxID=121845 RepID=A0A1S3D810_DIACI|nr:nuclear receptor subfamily 2 group E member 1-like [Diaphorina citri]
MALYFKDPHSEGVILNLARPKSTSPEPSPLMHSSPYTSPTIDKLHPAPPALPWMYLPMTSSKSMNESAADLLFMNMNWARSLPAFTSLSLRDQAYTSRRGSRVRFKTGSKFTAAIQGHTQIFLNKYIHTVYPSQPTRFCKIQLILPRLKSIPSLVLEELFFRNIIGHNTTIKKTIWHMYKNAGL